MTKEERKGTEVVGEIIPHCEACGAYLNIQGWSRLGQHEDVDVACEDCGKVAKLETELVFFTRKTAQTQQDKKEGQNG